MLKITVHNAERIPNLERFTSVDPMVTLIFQGMYVHKLYNHSLIGCGVLIVAHKIEHYIKYLSL